MITVPKFPDVLWDGLTAYRLSLMENRSSDAFDHDRMSAEIRSMQRYMLYNTRALTAVTPVADHATVNLNETSYIVIESSSSFTLDNPINLTSGKNQNFEVWIKNTGGADITVTLDTLYQRFDDDTGVLGASKIGYLKCTYYNSKWYVTDYNSEE